MAMSTGTGIYYKAGDKVAKISHAHLKDIRSRVTTHEGEVLGGKKGREYMDKYSEKYLGKNLSGSYRSEKIMGYAK